MSRQAFQIYSRCSSVHVCTPVRGDTSNTKHFSRVDYSHRRVSRHLLKPSLWVISVHARAYTVPRTRTIQKVEEQSQAKYEISTQTHDCRIVYTAHYAKQNQLKAERCRALLVLEGGERREASSERCAKIGATIAQEHSFCEHVGAQESGIDTTCPSKRCRNCSIFFPTARHRHRRLPSRCLFIAPSA